MIALRCVSNILRSNCNPEMKNQMFEVLLARVQWHEAPVDKFYFSLGMDTFMIDLEKEAEISRFNMGAAKPVPQPIGHLDRKLLQQVLEHVKYYTCENGALKGRLVACFGIDPYVVSFYPPSLQPVAYSKWANVLIPDEMPGPT